MPSELPGAALLDLGDDLFKVVNGFIAKYERANERPINEAAARQIADLVFENPQTDEEKEKHQVLLGHLLALVKRQGVPVAKESKKLLEKAKAQKELNAATGLETQELILAREWAAVIIKSGQTLTANEFMILQNTRCNKADQIAMLPPESQATIYAEAAEIVANGG